MYLSTGTELTSSTMSLYGLRAEHIFFTPIMNMKDFLGGAGGVIIHVHRYIHIYINTHTYTYIYIYIRKIRRSSKSLLFKLDGAYLCKMETGTSENIRRGLMPQGV